MLERNDSSLSVWKWSRNAKNTKVGGEGMIREVGML